MMKNAIKKNTRYTLAFCPLLLILSASLHASVHHWELSFFDTKGTEVGTAQFNYDTSTTATIILNPFEPSFIQTNYSIDEFSSQFYDVGLALAGEAWWNDPIEGTGMVLYNRYSPIPDRWDGWFIGDQYLGEPGQVIMEVNNTWYGYIETSETVKDATGTWTASQSPVPVPATFPLLAAALLGLGIAKRSRKHIQH